MTTPALRLALDLNEARRSLVAIEVERQHELGAGRTTDFLDRELHAKQRLIDQLALNLKEIQ
jgi:hypothetical protein